MENLNDNKVLVKVLIPFHQLKKGDTKRVTKGVCRSLVEGGYAEIVESKKGDK